MTAQIHGGMPQGSAVDLDFSVNTNPLGMPGHVRERLAEAVNSGKELWEKYPDPACTKLRELLAHRHLVQPERIVCGNGASELIMALVRMLRHRKGKLPLRCILPVPSFSEYERALLAAGAEINCYMLKETEDFSLTEALIDRLTSDMDLLFLCNPNNPTGRLIPGPLLSAILKRCRERDITVILDECFLELAGGEYRDGSGPIVLKAFTKLYAIPGLRLGYCICPDQATAEETAAQIPCWSVSGIAQMAGLTVLEWDEDIDYISQSREIIVRERDWLKERLISLKLRVIPGEANFLCFYCGGVPLFEKMLEKRILIRDCGNFRGMGKGWYRIAVKRHEENVILIQRLQEALNGT